MKINGMSYHLRPMPPLSDGVGLIFSYAVGGTAGRSRTRNQSNPIIYMPVDLAVTCSVHCWYNRKKWFFAAYPDLG